MVGSIKRNTCLVFEDWNFDIDYQIFLTDFQHNDIEPSEIKKDLFKLLKFIGSNFNSKTKKIKEHIKMKNKIINEILYIEEFFKAYIEFIFPSKYDKCSLLKKSWKNIISICKKRIV